MLSCFLVEDNALIRANLVATLEELLPLRVVGFAEDESSAVAWLADPRNACDLAIIDVFLKAGSGLEVLRRARAPRAGVRMVVLTNYTTPELRRRARALGADGVFDKSAELDELIAYCEALAAT